MAEKEKMLAEGYYRGEVRSNTVRPMGYGGTLAAALSVRLTEARGPGGDYEPMEHEEVEVLVWFNEGDEEGYEKGMADLKRHLGFESEFLDEFIDFQVQGKKVGVYAKPGTNQKNGQPQLKTYLTSPNGPPTLEKAHRQKIRDLVAQIKERKAAEAADAAEAAIDGDDILF